MVRTPDCGSGNLGSNSPVEYEPDPPTQERERAVRSGGSRSLRLGSSSDTVGSSVAGTDHTRSGASLIVPDISSAGPSSSFRHGGAQDFPNESREGRERTSRRSESDAQSSGNASVVGVPPGGVPGGVGGRNSENPSLT